MEHRITSAYHPQVTCELTVKMLTHIYLTFDFVFFGKGWGWGNNTADLVIFEKLEPQFSWVDNT